MRSRGSAVGIHPYSRCAGLPPQGEARNLAPPPGELAPKAAEGGICCEAAEERKLWYTFLNSYEFRYRRQKVIPPFIVDFYCHRARLAIEIDGSQHYSDFGKSYDRWRDGAIEKGGVKVLRLSNGDIHERFDGVKVLIDMITRKRIEELER